MATPSDTQVQQVSYTVGQSGHTYQWRAYRPKERRQVEPLRAEQAQFTAPIEDDAAGSEVHPMQDPYGERSTIPPIEPVPAASLPPITPPAGGLPPITPPAAALPPITPPAAMPAMPLLAPSEQGLPSADEMLLEQDAPQPETSDELMKSLADEQGLPGIATPESSDEDDDDLSTVEKLIAEGGPTDRRDCQYTPENMPKDIRDRWDMSRTDHLTTIGKHPAIEIKKPEDRPMTCDLAAGEFVPRTWATTDFHWQASGLCHKPAYFEDVHLERYGHSWGPYVQPVMSGAHFFLNVPILPYKMGLYPPGECVYTLGYYRPGSCAPYMLDPIPLSVRAGLAQAGAMVGLFHVIP